MRKGLIIDTLASVDIQKNVCIAERVCRIFEGVVYRENFKISPFRKVLEKLYALRKKCKDERNTLLQSLDKLIMNSLYAVQIRKDNNGFCKCKSQHWMENKCDDNVLDY